MPSPSPARGRRSPRLIRLAAAVALVAAVLLLAACAPASRGGSWSDLAAPGDAAGAGPAAAARPAPLAGPTLPDGWREEGDASWYGPNFVGRPTASGETFDPRMLTAAHRTLPFGTRVRVTHLDNGRSVTVRINDRGPFAHGRIIDLSRAAAEAIGLIEQGLGRVRLEAAGPPDGRRPLRVDGRLRGYDVILPGVPAGALVVLASDEGARLLARVVDLSPPARPGADGRDVYASATLVERLGAAATVGLDGAATQASRP
jgi:rare lipoprotein A